MVRIKEEEPQKRVDIEIQIDMDFPTKEKKPAELIDEGSFKLVTKVKTYKLRAQNAAEWVHKINRQFDMLNFAKKSL